MGVDRPPFFILLKFHFTAASCIRTPTYIYTEGCAHTVLYAYVRRTPRIRIIPSRGSKVNRDFKESETWPGGPDRPSVSRQRGATLITEFTDRDRWRRPGRPRPTDRVRTLVPSDRFA
jgi:hypothetical protein